MLVSGPSELNQRLLLFGSVVDLQCRRNPGRPHRTHAASGISVDNTLHDPAAFAKRNLDRHAGLSKHLISIANQTFTSASWSLLTHITLGWVGYGHRFADYYDRSCTNVE